MDLNDTKLEILAKHYSHTFDFLQTHLKKRDRLFCGVLLVLIVMFFQLYTPKETSDIITQLVSNKFELKTPINFLYVQSIIWFVLLAITIKYFQLVVFIERQYNYIHSLEIILMKQYEGGAFTREGDSYLNDYPIFLNWASFLYTILFPMILVIVISSKIIREYYDYGLGEVLIWFNGIIFVFIAISVVLYLFVVHSKNKKST